MLLLSSVVMFIVSLPWGALAVLAYGYLGGRSWFWGILCAILGSTVGCLLMELYHYVRCCT
jgi:hypothetical protein